MRHIEYKNETHCKSYFHVMWQTGAFVIIMIARAHVLKKIMLFLKYLHQSYKITLS